MASRHRRMAVMGMLGDSRGEPTAREQVGDKTIADGNNSGRGAESRRGDGERKWSAWLLLCGLLSDLLRCLIHCAGNHSISSFAHVDALHTSHLLRVLSVCAEPQYLSRTPSFRVFCRLPLSSSNCVSFAPSSSISFSSLRLALLVAVSSPSWQRAFVALNERHRSPI